MPQKSKIKILKKEILHPMQKPTKKEIQSASKMLFEPKAHPMSPETRKMLVFSKHRRLWRPCVKHKKDVWPPPNALFRPKVKGEARNEKNSINRRGNIMSEVNNKINKKTENQLLPVDTVHIVLPKGSYRLKKLRHFRFNSVGLSRTATKQEKQHGFYCPKVTIKKLSGTCSIEFSLSKLLQGDNLQEILIRDFPRIVKLLRIHLWSYGIAVSKENLRQADLYRADLAKNINLTCSVAEVLDTLKRCVGFGRKSMYQIQYKNGGRALRLQNASTDLLLYDKLHSYELVGCGDKLDVETDHYCQKPLYEVMTDSNKSILRIEQRYPNRKAVKKLFALYGVINPTFEDICNPKIGKDVITTEWQLLVKSCILPVKNLGRDLLKQVVNFLKKGRNNTLRAACSYVLIQHLLKEYSVKDLKKHFRPYVNVPTIDNFFADMKKWAFEDAQNDNALDAISKQITDWQPLQISVDSSDVELL